MFNPEDIVFTEKYRPKMPQNVIGDAAKKVIKHLEMEKEKPGSMGNFLFHSKNPGTGKTTLSKAIINYLECDYIVINSSDDRKLDVIREKVKGFALTQSTQTNKRRCIFLDEADGMSGSAKASQEALRNIMETYASNVFFILTCNNLNKIIEPIKSRCIVVPFAYPPKDEIYTYLEMICQKEEMQYSEEGIKTLIEMNYPSIRNAVIALQDLKVEGLSVTNENIKPVNQIFDNMWDLLMKKDWIGIKKVVMESTVDPRELNSFFWSNALEVEKPNLKLIQITCRNEKDFSGGSDPKIVFVTSVIEMCK